MALDNNKLAKDIEANCVQGGFKIISLNKIFIKAVADAVVKNIKEDAEVPVDAGSSVGTYKVK